MNHDSETYPGAASLSKPVRDTLVDIAQTGIAVRAVSSLNDFIQMCAQMGDVLSVEDVAPVPGSRRHVSNPAPVPLHSDGPQADIVGWYCVRQDEQDGESILLHTFPVLRGLIADIRPALASIRVPYYDSTTLGRPKGYAPILAGSDERDWRVNYAPWLLPELNDRQRDALAAFRAALSSADPLRVRLEPKSCLFIDNRRVLHGRGSLLSKSTRLLKRAWVRSNRVSAEFS